MRAGLAVMLLTMEQEVMVQVTMLTVQEETQLK
jgi:hypothetical protein